MVSLKVLDIFSGLGGWSSAWKDAGHDVFTIDFEPSFNPDLCADILSVTPSDLPWAPQVILASPPCETFSVASIGAHWTGGAKSYTPKTQAAVMGMKIAQKTVSLISELDPEYWVVENPRGVLRKLGIMPVKPDTAWFCHFDDTRAKPTDLWHNLEWSPGPQCHNQRKSHPKKCRCRDHESAPRGARSGTQGLANSADRALIPYALSESIMDHIVGSAMRKAYDSVGGV